MSASASADVIVGTATGVNCDPFTCNESGHDTGQASDYMQIYSSSAFSGPISIGSLTFYDSLYEDFQAATVLSGTYTISIGTTSASLGAVYPIAMTNTQTFFSGHLGGLIGSSFTISGTSYSYNPSAGNLVVDIVSSDQPNVANYFGIGYLDSDETGKSTTRAFQFTGHGSFQDDFGLVTGFGVAAGGGGGVSAVPLPATFPMFGVAILGLGAVGYGMGRRRNARATRTASNLG